MKRCRVAMAVALIGAAAAWSVPARSVAKENDPAPVLTALGEFDTGLGESNAEIIDVDPDGRRAFLTCSASSRVLVLDLAPPAKPTLLRTDALERGEPTSLAVHPSGAWYAVGVREALENGNDALLLRSCEDGGVVRTFDLGYRRGPDAVAASADGRWISVCLEAEDPWMPGGVAYFRCTAAGEPGRVEGPLEVALDGLRPNRGGFSTRWVDRPFNGALPRGVTVTSADGPVVIVDGNTRATVGGSSVEDGTGVVFHAGGRDFPAKFLWDGKVGDGDDGNVFLFPLDGTADSLEPEYAAFSPDGRLSVVTLQENNALLVVDLSGERPAVRAKNGVLDLGRVDHPADLTRKDPDRKSPAKFGERLQAEREPDGVALANLGGRLCAVIADEGDTFAPNSKGNPRVRGGRTLTVVALDDGSILGDTGNDLDAACDATGRWAAYLEAKRADRGGCEPESVAVVTLGGRNLAVVALERANALALVDITSPRAPQVLGLAGVGEVGAKSTRLAPEGLRIFRRGDRTLVLAAFEESGTVGVFEIR